jgi:uncharacterized protein (DUF58 family)
VEQQPRVQQFVDTLRARQAPGMSPTVRLPMSAVRATASVAPIFDPQMLTKLGRLEVIARTVVDGFLSGKHRSTHKGGCTDFAEYRPYTQGDDIRQLDWRKFAKTDRYYVKRYDDETNLQALLIADASGSMQFGMSTVTKWRYAQMAAACLGHLLLRQRDSVGLAVVGEHLRDFVKPQPRANHLSRVINVLERIEASGKSKLDESLQELTGRLKRRGMVILLSDCFGDVAKLKHVLEQFRLRGHDVLVFQILAPEELDFPFKRESFFQDLELPRRMQINPNALRKQYLVEFRAFREQLRQVLTDVGADLVTLRTDQDLGETLAQYLRRRAAQKTATLARTH